MGLLSKWAESLDYEYEILPSCSRYVSPRSNCEKCAESCNERVISIIKGKPIIHHNRCVECGKCISACPVQAIVGIYPKRTIIQNQLVINGQNIPTVKELLILYKKGIKTIIGETSTLIELWKQKIEEANTILSQLNEAPFSVSIKSVEQEVYYSRREIFSLWKKEGKSALNQVAPAKWRFNHDDFDVTKYYENYQFTKITVDIDKCILCTACQKLCKKKCFHINEDGFLISSQGCTACQICADSCPAQAITVEEQISEIQETSLLIFNKVCHVCHKTFNTLREHDEKCTACMMRESFSKNRREG